MKGRDLISPYDCVIQYKSKLNTKLGKPFEVRKCTSGVVIFLYCRTPILNNEVDLKYGGRDTTSGSLVFPHSKDDGASGNPLPELIYKPRTFICLIWF